LCALSLGGILSNMIGLLRILTASCTVGNVGKVHAFTSMWKGQESVKILKDIQRKKSPVAEVEREYW
jgi:hypothetical protein